MVELAGNSTQTAASPRWCRLNRIDRRVVGVLVEKAKTTPDAYPMSLNALTTGCNQKSNRDPLMQLEPDDVEQSIQRLRELGAVAEISGTGRVPRYRHYLYEWLGVDKVELAVMAELLLRGPQTVGELRARAARMEPIADLPALMPVVRSLIDKGLVVSLTPEGRGQVVTHALFSEEEMDKILGQFGGRQAAEESISVRSTAETLAHERPVDSSAALQVRMLSEQIQDLQRLFEAIRDDVEQLKDRIQRVIDESEASE